VRHKLGGKQNVGKFVRVGGDVWIYAIRGGGGFWGRELLKNRGEGKKKTGSGGGERRMGERGEGGKRGGPLQRRCETGGMLIEMEEWGRILIKVFESGGWRGNKGSRWCEQGGVFWCVGAENTPPGSVRGGGI